MSELISDTELLDFLEKLSKEGGCPGVINDDAGRWAVSSSGTQNVPDDDEPSDIWTSFLVLKDEWYPDIRTAIKHAMKLYDDGEL